MKTTLNNRKTVIFAWMLSACGLVTILLFGNQTKVNAQEHQHQHQHHDHHEATPEVKGYVSMQANYTIPEVMLVESDGKEKLLSKTVDPNKPVMLNFIFTTCTAICPSMSATFAQVAQKMDRGGETVQLVSISVDPEQDTPTKLKEYAKKFEAGSMWRLFTGTTANSILTQRAFDAYRGDKMNHVPLTFIRGANSVRWARIEGIASADELIKEYRALASK